MNLTRLAGNGPLKRQLELETARRGLSHAYILSGPAGSGKRTLAGLLAAALVCTGGGERPCLSCPNCRKALAGIHPDIVRAGDDGKDITVAQVRQLRADAYIRPNEADRKVYILENAQTMNPSAQNAMLKLLEEGPGYAAFLLLTNNAAAEMEERIKNQMAEEDMIDESKLVQARTFDSFCLSIVMDSPELAGNLLGLRESLTRGATIVQNDTLNYQWFGTVLDDFLARRGEDYGKWASIGSECQRDLMNLINRLMSRGVFPMRRGWFGLDAEDIVLPADPLALYEELAGEYFFNPYRS